MGNKLSTDNKASDSAKLSKPVTAAVASASFCLFLGGLPLLSTQQGCFLSPLSIVYALSLALNGAGAESPTHAELLRVVSGAAGGNQQPPSEAELNSELGRAMTLLNGQNSPSDGADGSQVVLANSLWTHRGLKLRQAYVDAMASLYQATAREATGGAKDVNDWVAGVTKGMIKDLVQDDNFDAILANAIYFKGLWTHAFKRESTSLGDFTTGSGAAKQLSFMQQTFEPRDRIQGVRKEGLYEAVSLPYKGDTFSAIAILPDVGVDTAVVIKDWAAGPQAFQLVGRLHLKIPKFKVSSQLSLTPVLKGLGVTTAFGAGANFSRMSKEAMYINDVVHKAVVEVDEEGTVAAAATAVIMLRGMPEPPRELVFNRPFVFIIQHNPTGLPAFVGVVTDPSA